MSPALHPAPDVTVVTGAAGWFGTALMHELTGESAHWRRAGEIRALVETPEDAARLEGLGSNVRTIVGDVRERAAVSSLFDGVGSTHSVDVIHAAGVIHPRQFADFTDINVDGTTNTLQSAIDARARRFVHVSSNSPFGTNPHPTEYFRQHEPYRPYFGYGRSKMQAELAVFEAVERGLHATIVRPPWFYGPFQPPRQTTFFQMVRTGRFPVFGDGQQRRSMVYVGHLVDGVMRAELADIAAGGAWWVADARAYTVTEIIETVGRALRDEGFQVSANRLRVPDIVGRMAERADAGIQRTGRYHQQVHVLGEMNKTIACDISATRRDLGYQPDTSLYDGMRESIRWCVDQGYDL